MKDNFTVVRTNVQNIWSLEAIKNNLRITHDHDDAVIENLIDAAVNAAENFTSLSLKLRNIKLVVYRYDQARGVKLKYSPVFAINTINEKDVGPDEYYIDRDLYKLYIKPHINTDKTLTITYQAGFTQSLIPAGVKQGILAHIANMYDKSEELGGVLSEVIRSYYMPYKFLRV
jgi:uncharacterized phiE125 gp8 family phage protein